MFLITEIKLAYKTNGKSYKIYFSTDLDLLPEKINQYYEKRFQIEFLFRDAKQHLGLEVCMSEDQQALTFHFNTCITALNLAKVDDKMNRTERTAFSIINYKRRRHNEKLLKLFIFKFDL
ncbi:MAG: transposase, partial [Candidatus Sericytochromatia bacterium]|nr:transposase [Candidatus Sericytochromatia bacterium]